MFDVQAQAVAEAQEADWRIDTREAARRAGVAAENVERHVFWAWRLKREQTHVGALGARAGEGVTDG